ncbi:unknown [Prevotella sp. CAG:873]|nr:unknown [Prevotella sp. CAG:873]
MCDFFLHRFGITSPIYVALFHAITLLVVFGGKTFLAHELASSFFNLGALHRFLQYVNLNFLYIGVVGKGVATAGVLTLMPYLLALGLGSQGHGCDFEVVFSGIVKKLNFHAVCLGYLTEYLVLFLNGKKSEVARDFAGAACFLRGVLFLGSTGTVVVFLLLKHVERVAETFFEFGVFLHILPHYFVAVLVEVVNNLHFVEFRLLRRCGVCVEAL